MPSFLRNPSHFEPAARSHHVAGTEVDFASRYGPNLPFPVLRVHQVMVVPFGGGQSPAQDFPHQSPLKHEGNAAAVRKVRTDIIDAKVHRVLQLIEVPLKDSVWHEY